MCLFSSAFIDSFHQSVLFPKLFPFLLQLLMICFIFQLMHVFLRFPFYDSSFVDYLSSFTLICSLPCHLGSTEPPLSNSFLWRLHDLKIIYLQIVEIKLPMKKSESNSRCHSRKLKLKRIWTLYVRYICHQHFNMHCFISFNQKKTHLAQKSIIKLYNQQICIFRDEYQFSFLHFEKNIIWLHK